MVWNAIYIFVMISQLPTAYHKIKSKKYNPGTTLSMFSNNTSFSMKTKKTPMAATSLFTPPPPPLNSVNICKTKVCGLLAYHPSYQCPINCQNTRILDNDIYLAILRYVVSNILMNTTILSILPEPKTLEWWISRLMLDLLFFLISRLNKACSLLVINLQTN